jgi:hypothetical protein
MIKRARIALNKSRTTAEETRMSSNETAAVTQSLLDKVGSMPEQAPRSKLEPYYEAIRGLRRKRYTYQDIARFLATEAGLTVAASTIHAFMAVRARRRGPATCESPQAENGTTTAPTVADKTIDTAAARIEALRRRQTPESTTSPRFEYNEGDGLTKIR